MGMPSRSQLFLSPSASSSPQAHFESTARKPVPVASCELYVAEFPDGMIELATQATPGERDSATSNLVMAPSEALRFLNQQC